MKKTFLFFAMAIAAFALASCNEDIAIEEAVTTSGSELVFKASMGVDTKVEIGETGVVTWKDGDQIKVFALDATYNPVTNSDQVVSEVIDASSISSDGKTAYFVSSNLGNAKLLGAKYFVAYLVGSGIGDPTLKNEIFGFPTGSNFGVSGIKSMSVAYCSVDDPTLSFKNFACLIKVSTKRTDAYAIAVQGRNGEKADHQGIISFDFQFHDTTESSAQGNVATRTGGQAGTFYVALAPGIEFTKGFKILLYDQSFNELEQFSYPYPFTTVANRIYNFGDFDNSYQANDMLLKKIIKDRGYNPDDYYRISYNLSYYSFFNSTGGEGYKLCSAANSGQSDATPKRYCATQVFSKEDLPNGTLLVVRPDHMYRPEGWQTLGSKNSGSRPDNVKTTLVEIDDAWWGTFTWRAFNIARNDSSFLESELYLGWNTMSELQETFGIFIPKDKVPASSPLGMLIAEGKDPDDYRQMYVNVIQKSFWNSSNGSYVNSYFADTMNGQGADYKKMIPQTINKEQSNSVKFHATNIFSKDQIPNGSVIIVKPGYQYRPDAWVSLSEKNGSRPGNVTTNVVTVDDSWWGSFNYRAFNILEITTSNGTYFSNAGNELTRASFAIFVPKASAEDVK